MKIKILLFVEIIFGLLAADISHGAPTFKLLASFDRNNGYFPNSSLIQGNNRVFYGTTFQGGKGHEGTVFKMTSNGRVETLVSFGLVNGAGPTLGLALATNGILYGTTSVVTNSRYGAIFSVTPRGQFKNIHIFDGLDGITPSGLFFGTDGNLYGMTSQGGDNGFGTMFKMTTDGTFTTLYSFNGYDGGYNKSQLVEDSDGNFYGTTMDGGSTINTNFNPYLAGGGAGTVFKMTPDGVLVWSVSFNGQNGVSPSGSLVEGDDGNFYGTTFLGGTNWPDQTGGTIFEITPDGVLTSLYSFDYHVGGIQDSNLYGVNPYPLVKAEEGTLYGTTLAGGNHGDGTIFKITTNGWLTVLYSFGTITNVHGYPLDGFGSKYLTIGEDGSLYGTSYYGGEYDNDGNGGLGTVFRLSMTRPTISVTRPHQNGIVATSWITLSGKTKGAVADVFYQSNGGDWTEATTSDNWTNWTASISLTMGINDVRSFAVDTSGDSSLTNTLKIFRIVPAAKK